MRLKSEEFESKRVACLNYLSKLLKCANVHLIFSKYAPKIIVGSNFVLKNGLVVSLGMEYLG